MKPEIHLEPIELLFGARDYEAALEVNASKKGYKNGTLYKQAGNSMPVPVLEAIFERLEGITNAN